MSRVSHCLLVHGHWQNEWDLHNLLRRCVRPGLIEFHLSVLLINNAVDVTGLYHVLRIGDDVCVSGDSGGRWHYAANGPCSNEVVTGRETRSMNKSLPDSPAVLPKWTEGTTADDFRISNAAMWHIYYGRNVSTNRHSALTIVFNHSKWINLHGN